MTSVAEAPASTNQSTIDYHVAFALKGKGYTYKEIASELGCNPSTLKQGFMRKGYTRSVHLARTRVTPKEQSSQSDAAKSALSLELSEQLSALKATPASYKDLANSGQGRASLVKTIAETAKIVHGWGNEAGSMTFGLVLLSDAQEVIEAKAVDVESTAVTEPSACGVSEPKQDSGTHGTTPQ